jgi:hypothetical protein
MIPQPVLAKASRIARKRQAWIYVFSDPDLPYGYGTATDEDAETWYLGQEPEAAFGPDGERLAD